MVGTEFLQGQGLGNQLFCYVSARCIAEDLGYEFGTAGQEQLAVNIHSKKGMYFMDMDLGVRIAGSREQEAENKGKNRNEKGTENGKRKEEEIEKGIEKKKEDFRIYREKEERLYLKTCAHDMLHGCYTAGADEDIYKIGDNTLLYGNLQAERYFARHREEIKEWLKVKEEYDSHEYTRDNLCIINIRGGEYTDNRPLFLRRKYWLDAMKNMRAVREDMEFMAVTDDVAAARRILPEVEAYHFDLAGDYVALKNARYLILSNSTFAFFPAFTSETVQMVIAPKYWARHNVSDGYWASGQNIYEGFLYQDRNGKLSDAETCRQELINYRQTGKMKGKGVPYGKKSVALRQKQDRALYWLDKIRLRLVRAMKGK